MRARQSCVKSCAVGMRNAILRNNLKPFSSLVAANLLVSTENHDLWPGPTPEVRDSRTSRYSAHGLSQVWQIWLVLVSIYCVYKAIQNRNVVRPGQRSWFSLLTKSIAVSGDENDLKLTYYFSSIVAQLLKLSTICESPLHGPRNSVIDRTWGIG